MRIDFLPDELWWGGAVHDGRNMPFTAQSTYQLDLANECVGNQTSPLYVSNKGRYIWSDDPYTITIADGHMETTGSAAVYNAGSTLADAYRAAKNTHFPFSGKVPDLRFYRTPQYNTWSELTYNQFQKPITEYAENIVKNGYTPGIFMIDDGWQTGYGVWRFNRERFEDAKAMVDHLHELGFTVMVWIVPYLCADSPEFRVAMEDPTRLLRNADGSPAIIRWWNGYSAALDMTSAGDIAWLRSVCDSLLHDLGVDGFKCDGGSVDGYPDGLISLSGASKVELTAAWNRFALSYDVSEVKDTWKACGLPFNQRLRDKSHVWGKQGLGDLLPDAMCASLTGHVFLCPDMVGGGSWVDFINGKPLDEELIVRFAQASALFPAMQFSVAPWRILSPENAARVKAMQDLHTEMGDYIAACVEKSAVSGEPIMKPLCYDYPNSGLDNVTDEFLLGDELLVAPVLVKGAVSRKVIFPAGQWKAADGTVYEGKAEVPASLDVLPYFRKLSL